MQDSTLSAHAGASAQETAAASAGIAERKISIWLGLGILVLPFVFSWFTLRSGYSQKARTVAFSWLLVYALIRGASAPSGDSQLSSDSSAAPTVTANQSSAQSANRATPRRESREEQMARWISEIRAQGGQCVMVGNFVEQYVNQFGVDDWKVTKALEMASEKGCF